MQTCPKSSPEKKKMANPDKSYGWYKAQDFSHYIEEGSGHVLSDAMWDKTLAFFQKHLGAAESPAL